ncbi:MAG: glycosyltransferase family 4 protein [Anaerolineae bacterium]
MLIGIDASRAAIPKRTGTEAYALHLIQHLLPLAMSQGHTVRLYFNQPPAASLFPQNDSIEHRVIPFPRMWTHLRLGAELHLRPPDLFFTPAHVIPYSWFGRSMATVHDLGYEHFPEAHTAEQLRYLRWSTKHNAKRSRAIVADSQATKRDLVEIYGTDPSKITVAYPGIDPILLQDAPTAQPLKRDRPYILFLSTIQPRKNVGRIIEAFATVADQISHDLILAGQTGWRSEAILAQIEALPPLLKDRIVLPGFVPDEDKVSLIKGASAFLYPSLNEGFGFPLLEANACGVPIITADSSSLAELAATGGAITINPESVSELSDAILQVLSDGSLRQRLIKQGHKNVERFRWQTAAEQILSLMTDRA